MATSYAATTERFRRAFVTPEGVDLRLELATGGSRAGAFVIDLLIMVILLVVVTVVLAFLAVPGVEQFLLILFERADRRGAQSRIAMLPLRFEEIQKTHERS